MDNIRQPAIKVDGNSIDTGTLTIRAISPVECFSIGTERPTAISMETEGSQDNNRDATYTLTVYKFTRRDRPEDIVQGKPFYKVDGITETKHLSKILFDDASAIYAYRLELINSKGEATANSQLTVFYGGTVVIPFFFNICLLLCNPQTISFCAPPSLGLIYIPMPFAWVMGSCSPGTLTYSINGAPYLPVPFSGYFPVAGFQAGNNTLTFKLSCNCNSTPNSALTRLINSRK